MTLSMVDVHCHLLPDIDDGARDWAESLEMAQLAVENGTATIIATPHQLGNFGENGGDDIRARVTQLQQRLVAAGIPLQVLPGAEVRIEAGMMESIVCGQVLTLGDHGRHVLLELPHEIYLPLESILNDLSRRSMIGILAHPERNRGILRRTDVVAQLVDAGCLMQITAGSLCGAFGSASQQLAESLLRAGLVHFVASDGHGTRTRLPLLRPAYERVVELVDVQTADDLCRQNPLRIANGQSVRRGRRAVPVRRRRWWTRRAVA